MTVFGLRISGAHYNPINSLAYMLRKDVGNFPRILGFAYIIAQVIGAFFGALLSWFLLVSPLKSDGVTKDFEETGNIYPVDYLGSDGTLSVAGSVFAAIIAEILGAFFVTFFFLTQTETKTTFSKMQAITCFIVAASYVGARAMVQGEALAPSTRAGPVLNPAIALGTTLIMLVNQADKCGNFWLYVLLPFIGSVLAVLFHEFVFKKSQ
jgi:glycerol uptake facilitator-like aquaporin